MRGGCRDSPGASAPHTCTASLMTSTPTRGDVCYDWCVWICRHHPESVVHRTVHLWCCTFWVWADGSFNVFTVLVSYRTSPKSAVLCLFIPTLIPRGERRRRGQGSARNPRKPVHWDGQVEKAGAQGQWRLCVVRRPGAQEERTRWEVCRAGLGRTWSCLCFKIIRVPVEESWKRSQPSAGGAGSSSADPCRPAMSATLSRSQGPPGSGRSCLQVLVLGGLQSDGGMGGWGPLAQGDEGRRRNTCDRASLRVASFGLCLRCAQMLCGLSPPEPDSVLTLRERTSLLHSNVQKMSRTKLIRAI